MTVHTSNAKHHVNQLIQSKIQQTKRLQASSKPVKRSVISITFTFDSPSENLDQLFGVVKSWAVDHIQSLAKNIVWCISNPDLRVKKLDESESMIFLTREEMASLIIGEGGESYDDAIEKIEIAYQNLAERKEFNS